VDGGLYNAKRSAFQSNLVRELWDAIYFTDWPSGTSEAPQIFLYTLANSHSKSPPLHSINYINFQDYFKIPHHHNHQDDTVKGL